MYTTFLSDVLRRFFRSGRVAFKNNFRILAATLAGIQVHYLLVAFHRRIRIRLTVVVIALPIIGFRFVYEADATSRRTHSHVTVVNRFANRYGKVRSIAIVDVVIVVTQWQQIERVASGVFDGAFISLNSIRQRSTGQTRRPEYVVIALVL